MCFSISGGKLTTRLRSRSFKVMLKQEMGWHDEERNSTGALTAQLAEDARLVQGVSQSIVVYSIDSYSQWHTCIHITGNWDSTGCFSWKLHWYPAGCDYCFHLLLVGDISVICNGTSYICGRDSDSQGHICVQREEQEGCRNGREGISSCSQRMQQTVNAIPSICG